MCTIEFTVNGEICKVNDSLPRDTSLNAYLRYTLALPGTKAMCHEGGCGSCIVMVRAKRYPSGRLETFSVNSCLVLVFSCHGWEITTVEGVGSRKEGYSDVQKRIVAFNGTQCGYCTPGWIMQLTSLIDKNLTMAELEKCFGGNTCRCTGFRSILDTIQSFAIDAPPELCQKVKDIEELHICKKKPEDDCEKREKCQRRCSGISEDSDWSVLEDIKAESTIALIFGKYRFFKVFDQNEIFDILNKYGVHSYMFVDGNTAKGIVETFEYPDLLIDISGVRSLKKWDIDQNLVLGANVSLEDTIKICKETSENNSEFAYLAEIVKHLELIAHIPVRKIGSLAGNLMFKRAIPTYPSDLFVILECIGATITIRKNGKRCIESLKVRDFIKFDMTGALILNIKLPPFSPAHIFRSYKIMPRNQNALAIVNAAFLIKLGRNNVIEHASLVYGNIDPEFVHATKTENYLVGKYVFTDDNLQHAIEVLDSEVIPVELDGEQSVECRKKLVLGLFYKFILNICPIATARKYRSGGQLIARAVSTGKADYQSNSSLYPLNKPIDKLEGRIQASGEATFANDLPPLKKEVFGAFVLSTVHSGEVESIDEDEVLAIDGVVAIYTPKDIPGVNSFICPGFREEIVDEEIIATSIKIYGQPVAIVVAKSEKLAADVAKKVKVTYKNVSKVAPVLTINDAKKDIKRYLPSKFSIKPTSRGTDIKKIIKGVYEIEAQYHYYMEPITCVVIPVDEMLEVYDSTQWMDLTQGAIARCLGISSSQVLVKIRRVGGAFGGKVSRNAQAATACALVAKKLNVPCRFILPLQTNLTIAGRRLPSQCEYEVGVDDNGKIQYLDATIVEDKGCSINESVLEYTVQAFPNCYNVDTWSLKTANVLTDLPCNTWARSPGFCEGISSIEHIMTHIAFTVGKDVTEVREINMRTDDNDIPELTKTLKADADYDNRVKEIETFNKSNRWMKRAISVNDMSYPIVYYGNNSVLVSIYRGDGSVTLCTGGIELGQGVNTKAAQVCAYELDIPVEYVKIVPYYSFASVNVYSGGSMLSECICYAVIKACEIIKSRLAPIRESMPDGTWEEIIEKAAASNVDLSCLYMMWDTDPALKDYTVFTVSIIETQLDVLTGRFQILRVDLLEDVGVSINPKVDMGQIQGAYIQGLGYYTSEKFQYNKQTGKLLSNRSLNYHVPLALDIPVEFNVALRRNHRNANGVLGSKACGELAVSIAHGVTHALRSCIMESRKDSGYDPNEWIYIPIPYETEVILKALDVKTEEFLLTK